MPSIPRGPYRRGADDLWEVAVGVVLEVTGEVLRHCKDVQLLSAKRAWHGRAQAAEVQESQQAGRFTRPTGCGPAATGKEGAVLALASRRLPCSNGHT